MARKSVTLVNVGPGTKRSPMPLKNPVELLSARNAAGSRPAAAGAAKRRRVDEGAGRIVGAAAAAVGSIGIGGQRRNAGGAVEVDGKRESVFLVGPAAALAAQGDRQLAAGKDDDAAALGAQVAGQTGVFRRHVPRLALQAVAEHDAFVAGCLGAPLRRAAAHRPAAPRSDRSSRQIPCRPASAFRSPDRRARWIRRQADRAGSGQRWRGRRRASSGRARSARSRSRQGRRQARRRSPASPAWPDKRAGRAGRP